MCSGQNRAQCLRDVHDGRRAHEDSVRPEVGERQPEVLKSLDAEFFHHGPQALGIGIAGGQQLHAERAEVAQVSAADRAGAGHEYLRRREIRFHARYCDVTFSTASMTSSTSRSVIAGNMGSETMRS